MRHHRICRMRTASPVPRWGVSTVALLLVSYLAAVALQPSIIDAPPPVLRWFGRPGSVATITIMVAVLVVAVCMQAFRSNGSHRLVGVSFTVIAALISVSAILGLGS